MMIEAIAKRNTKVFTLSYDFFGEYFDIVPGLKEAIIKAAEKNTESRTDKMYILEGKHP